MGRIIAQTTVTNHYENSKSIECGMLVDTGVGALILPTSWKPRFGRFHHSEPVRLMMANQEVVDGEACAPVEIRIEGFRPVWNEVVFLDADSSEDGDFEPLLGHVILGQALAAVDRVNHRLVSVPHIDLKRTVVRQGLRSGHRRERVWTGSPTWGTGSPRGTVCR